MQDLLPLAERLGALLKAGGETVAVSESSSGGLVSAALLAVPGASAHVQGGAVVYTGIPGPPCSVSSARCEVAPVFRTGG